MFYEYANNVIDIAVINAVTVICRVNSCQTTVLSFKRVRLYCVTGIAITFLL